MDLKTVIREVEEMRTRESITANSKSMPASTRMIAKGAKNALSDVIEILYQHVDYLTCQSMAVSTEKENQHG